MEARLRKGNKSSEEQNDFLPTDISGSYTYRSKEKKGQENLFSQQFCLVITVVFILASFCFVWYIGQRLPRPLTAADISLNPNTFIEERARNDLILLTGVGPRTCGSHENDVLTVDSLMRLLNEIKRTAATEQKLDIEIQKSSGAFSMHFQDGLTSSYANVPNVIARLEGSRNTTFDSILVNCHFDSVPGSPGGSDNMVNCAVMIEALRILAAQKVPLMNPIVFLFNGAEENGLQGAHAFLKGRTEGSDVLGHKWAKGLKAFVNLEAAGAGGREVLFQTGPGNGWIVSSVYATAPHPFGSAVGEEVFQRGLIPSDTDFRIFRDFAQIPGLDMAFIKNGFVYHTKHDKVDQITAGSIQHVGDNVLHLITTMGNLKFDEELKSDNRNMIFFDVFGFTMVAYSETTGHIINLIVAIVTLIIAYQEADGNIFLILKNVGIVALAWAVGILSSVLVGAFFNVLGFAMPFFSYPSSVYLIFGIPCLMGQISTFGLLLKKEDMCWMASKTTLALILLITTFFTRIVFVLMINIGFGIVGWYAARIFFREFQRRLLFYLLIGEAFPFTLSIYLSSITTDTFVPIMGRSGTEVNPNLFVGFLTAFILTVPAFTGIVPIFLFFKKEFLKFSAIIVAFVVVFIFIFVGRVPYGEMTPMRIHLVEVDRSMFLNGPSGPSTTDSGYWFFNLDPNIPKFMSRFEEEIHELKDRVELVTDECEHVYCRLPFYFPVAKRVKRTQWVPTKEGLSPELKSRVKLDITEDTFISQSRRRLTLSFIGPDHMTIVLSPGLNWELVKSSLKDGIPATEMEHKGRPIFFIYHGRGIDFQRFEFTLDLVRKRDGEDDGPALEVLYSTFFLQGYNSKSLDTFAAKFPKWAYTLAWSSVTNTYIIH